MTDLHHPRIRNQRQLIGHVPVDAGTLCIVDPCYLIQPNASHHQLTQEIWSNVCKEIMMLGHSEILFAHIAGTGLAIDVNGDGSYPVYVEKNSHGRTLRIVIEVAS